MTNRGDRKTVAADERAYPLEAAVERGDAARLRLLTMEGDALSAEQAAIQLGIAPDAVDRLRRKHKLLGVPDGVELRYPAWQFQDGSVLPGLHEVLTDLRDHDPLFFGRSGLNRFDAPAGEYGVLYAGESVECAFIETFGSATGIRAITL